MVPMLTCGLVRSNFAFATDALLETMGLTPYDGSAGRWVDYLLGCRSHSPCAFAVSMARHADPFAGAHSPCAFAVSMARHADPFAGAHSPCAFAMISFATLPGTSA